MYEKFIKRILDIVFSLILFPFFLVITLIVAVVIKVEDGGKVFYYANRLGKNGNDFKMYKFRSMKMNAPDIRNSDGSTFNSNDDPRLTRIGKILRKTSVDELPQLINVLLGDMSFIGPRPDLSEQLKYYSDGDIKRLEVLPGISGYNQAYFRNNISWKERIANDIYYVEEISFLFDLRILLKTVKSIFFQKGVYSQELNGGGSSAGQSK
ncbi:sugar transferase [Paenibacillus sp. sgz500992]|uniref:sugar transferase n=1 Tax=Paenibacillus sp. sgz500992 TaxID=3242476 RepID=UPI0036D35467